MDQFEIGTEVLVDDSDGYGPGWGTVVEIRSYDRYLIEFDDGHSAIYRADRLTSLETYDYIATCAVEQR